MNKVEAELVAAMPHRHTHRGAFTPGEVAARLLAALVADAAAEGAELLLVDRTARGERIVQGDRACQGDTANPAGRAALIRQLAGLVEVAAAEQATNSDLAAETRGWVRPPGSRARDGVPAWAIARRPGQPAAADPQAMPRLPQRDFGQPGDFGQPEDIGQPGDIGQHDSDQPGGVPPSATAVLSTAGDSPADWLRAGQALHRLLLRAATRWVFASLQSQPLESPQHRQEVRELLGLTGHPQLLLQFGRSNTAPATPRRPHVELRADLCGS